MISCGAVERHLVDVVRRAASDAVRLELEAHLESCGGCRETRAALGLLGALRDQPPPRLGPAAEARILEGIVEQLARTGGGAAPSGSPRGRRRRRAWPIVSTALALVVLAFGARALVPRHGERVGPAGAPTQGAARLPGPVPSSEPADLPGVLPETLPETLPRILDGQTLDATGPGVLAFEGAGVTYERGTALTFHPAARTLTLVRGQVEVDVTEHRAVRFRVTTPRFGVEVMGTRFVVTLRGVHTLRGRVRVLDPAGSELAIVSADRSWSAPAPGSTAGLPAPAERVVAATSVTDGTQVTAPRAAAVTVAVTELVTRARTALAEGNARRARRLLERARLAGPSRSEWPALELLQADALLVLREPEHAIAAYRRVARRHADAPEGETAAFVAGQLLFESGAGEEGAAVMNDYLARYPRGRFVREARERLAHPRPRPIE